MSQITRTACLVALSASVAPDFALAQEIGWEANGRDIQGTRYLPASGNHPRERQPPRARVDLSHRRGRAALRDEKKPAAFEATPLVVDGTMYVGTPLGRVIALDPATGRERWVFDPKIARDVDYGDFASRGVSTWLDEAAPPDAPAAAASSSRPRNRNSSRSTRATADPAPASASGGIVDLKAGLRIPPFEPQAYSMTSPPVVVNGVVDHRLVHRRQHAGRIPRAARSARSTRAPAR